MDKIIGLKDLRENMGLYSSAVQKGASFVVVRKSKPLFKIAPVDDGGEWEVAADFTRINKNGVSAEKILKSLRALNAKH